MSNEKVEFLLEAALQTSDDTEVNYHIRMALQHIQFQRDLHKLETNLDGRGLTGTHGGMRRLTSPVLRQSAIRSPDSNDTGGE